MLVYLDNANSTRVDPEVLKAMEPFFTEDYGAPTGAYGHSFGVKARDAVEKARESIARKINAEPEELIFTSGSTESNNLAIQGIVNANKIAHVLTSKIEHTSVLNVVRHLEKQGVKATYLDVDGEGFVNLEQLQSVLREGGPHLVSVHYANQEIGTIEDIAEIGKICREAGAIFHTDATQSLTKLPIDVKEMNIDSLTMAANVIHGPKGIGALYVRKGVKLSPMFFGTFNEYGIRPGTENVPAIVGFAKALEIANEEHNSRMRKLRDRLIDGLLQTPESRLNGPRGDKRLCSNANITFKYVEGESLMLHLDMRNIIITTGSACFSPTLEPSHVILALGLKHEDAHGSARFTFSKYNTEEEIDYTIENVKEVVQKLRELSPLYGKA